MIGFAKQYIFSSFLFIIISSSPSNANCNAFDSAPPLRGPVILTVSGEITNAARGPVGGGCDELFVRNGIEFERAAVFDHASLLSLGLVEVNADFPKGGETHVFTGVSLVSVLGVAGALGGSVSEISFTALDGYVVSMSLDDLRRMGAVLALKRDGVPFSIGDFGPIQLVFARLEREELSDMPDDNWIWSVYHIAVE